MGEEVLDVFSPTETLSKVLKIFSISGLYRDGEQLKYSCPLWKVLLINIICFSVNAYNIYFIVVHNVNPLTIAFIDFVRMFYLLSYIQYVIDLFFVYKYGDYTLNYYSLFNHIDRYIGIPQYYEIKKTIKKNCAIFITIGVINTGCDYCASIMSFGWEVTVICSINFLYIGLRMLSVLDIITQYIQIKYRLRAIRISLENLYSDIVNLDDMLKEVNIEMENDKLRANRLNALKIVGFSNRGNVVMCLSRCYLLLLEQCDYINTVYGFRVLINSIIYLMDMVMLLNLLIRQVMGTLVTTYDSGYLPLITIIMRTSTASCITLCGINCCEQIYAQGGKIIRFIDYLLISKKTEHEDYISLKELKDLITTRPVNFTALNFFRIDYPTLVSIASVIVTYTIILLQNIK